MIKATDLRLHNTVRHAGQPCRVVQLAEEAVIVQYADGALSGSLDPADLDGLDLTPEVLQRSGFVYTGETNDYQFAIDQDAVITVNPHIFGGHSVQLCVKGNWCGKPVQLLHELENIYLDLTGKELAID